MAGRKVRTLVVDDSSLIRTILKTSLSQHPEIEVVGAAEDGVQALKKIAALKPDVVTLDVEMPRLNGIGVLERVVGRAPVAFVMVSTLTQAGARITFEALSKGAFDYVAKPKTGGFAGVPAFRQRLQQLVLAAASSRGKRRPVAAAARPAGTAAPALPPNLERGWVVGIGISCGGPPTLTEMLPSFPSDFVPILITQHMPAQFTASFAKHLDDVCSMDVREAVQGDRPAPGTILVAPGGHHMKLVRQGASLVVRLDSGGKVSGHRPSADVMFDSIARSCGPRAVGVIMTGMGGDGAIGLGRMRNAGAWTIAQDEATSLVYGMPKEAVKAEAVDHIVPLPKIPLAVSRLLQRGVRRAPATSR